jgi:hypothetical protein
MAPNTVGRAGGRGGNGGRAGGRGNGGRAGGRGNGRGAGRGGAPPPTEDKWKHRNYYTACVFTCYTFTRQMMGALKGWPNPETHQTQLFFNTQA